MGLFSYILPKKAKGKKGAEDVTPQTPAALTSPSGFMTPQNELSYEAEKRRTLRFDMMSDYLRQQQIQRGWATATGDDQGVVLKVGRGEFVSTPSELAGLRGGFKHTIEMLNVRCAMTLDTPVIRRFAQSSQIRLPGGLNLQVLPDMSYVPGCQKHQSAAYLSDRAQLLVWDDDPTAILARASKLEVDLLNLIWKDDDESMWNEKKSVASPIVSEVSSVLESEPSDGDADVEAASSPSPKPVLVQPFIVGLTMALMMYFSLLAWTYIIQAVNLDGQYIECAYILMLPFTAWTSLFFWQALVGQICQLFGPVKQVHQNSRFYSGLPPKRIDRNRVGGLPHFTIQMPVYKEGLHSVIVPTIRSVNAAIATYEMQGGTANIFINDDGLQLLPEEERRARMEVYEEYGIGWTARPKHNPKPAEGEEVFIRAGKFKKASNMNYGMWISVRVEEKMLALERHASWTVNDEAGAYAQALVDVVEEDEGRTWADGDIRFGDYILIIDSDTQVPRDCLLDAASEMEQNPRTAILQYASGVMNVTDSFFECAITWFTRLIYSQIRYAVACGDTAPFVGHNAILRWDSLQAIEYDCPLDNRVKWWSEATVSEDFDMSLRLQGSGYLVRLAGYISPSGETYNEGVSLTIYDELARWEKYAFGCSELLFNPLKDWFRKGPFTKLFRDFCRSPIPVSSKLTIMSYIGTYYAIGSAWLLTVANYFVIGWYNGYYDAFYRSGFGIFIGLLFVFTGLGNVALAVMRWRTGEKALGPALLENFSWIPLMAIFFGGISLHVSQALLCHLFSIDMQWGSTSKEATNHTFFEEIPRVAKAFRGTFAFVGIASVGMVILAVAAPAFWRIDTFVAIFPLALCVGAHALLPVVLNPNLIVFKW